MKQFLASIFLHYLRLFARLQLAKVQLIQHLKGKKLTIIGITGSAGKSSTLLALEAAIKPQFRVTTNYGANSESGIPLNILGLCITNFSLINWLKIAFLAPVKLITNWKTYEVYLVEMGIDGPYEPKNMSYLLKIIRPNIGVFLNAGSVHSQNFDPLLPKSLKSINRLSSIVTEIAKEKAKLINSLPPSGFAVLNIDDPNILATTSATIATRLTLGHNPDTTLQILSSSSGPLGFHCTFSYQKDTYQINLPHHILPDIFAVSFTSAFLVATTLGLTPKKNNK